MHGNYPNSRIHSPGLVLTDERSQERDLDVFPIPDRSLIDYEKYHQFVGHAGVKYSVAVQATRGCPYRCFYCDIYKTTKFHFRRSDEHLFREIDKLYDCGIRRIEFIDDIFNVNWKGFKRFFEYVIRKNYKFQFFFPTGLKGDLLTKELIDLMVEGGSVGVNLSLEHASPRMQKVMRKGLDVDKLRENLDYITGKYPQVVLTLNAMHGFPTETEEEAEETLKFILETEWIDFAYLHNVRIFPGTELEHFALEVGVPEEIIRASQDMSYHELSPTLPFSKEFTEGIRVRFLRDYVFNKNRLKDRIKNQLTVFSRDELDQRYNAYFPSKSIVTLDDVLKIARIKLEDVLPEKAFDESTVKPIDINTAFSNAFKREHSTAPEKDGEVKFKLLLIDLSSYYEDSNNLREYNVLEPPLGLMALQTYLAEKLGPCLETMIIKSRMDFNSSKELYQIVTSFSPNLIGIRAMTFYKGLLHDSVRELRELGVTTPIFCGGPYPTASYNEIVFDRNIELVCVGEGETTLLDVVRSMMSNNFQLPDESALVSIPGLAFFSDRLSSPRVHDPDDWKKILMPKRKKDQGESNISFG
jgi:radical SAM superfamily enzyme YgiQ (UPF0313 family)